MFDGFPRLGAPEFLIIGIVFALMLAIVLPYALTVKRALARCDRSVRAMPPGLVWLLLVPVIHLAWNFVIVWALHKSLPSEFARRGGAVPRMQHAWWSGVAMSVLSFGTFLPKGSTGFEIASAVCWVYFWIQIARINRQLAAPA